MTDHVLFGQWEGNVVVLLVELEHLDPGMEGVGCLK